jgi:hypothetical protein
LLLLLGMLIQVQPVLACEMSGHTMPVDACCCDGVMPESPSKDSAPAEDACCEVQSSLALKEPGLDKELPAVLPKPPDVELSSDALVFVVFSTLWADPFSSESKLPPDIPSSFASRVGAKTYLHTQRLRI